MSDQRSLAFKALWIAIAMITPYALLIVYAHLIPHAGMGWTPILVAGAVGLTIFAVGPWSDRTRLIGGLLYLIAAIFALPFMGLLAECSTGNCL